jgi:hypothetical protein
MWRVEWKGGEGVWSKEIGTAIHQIGLVGFFFVRSFPFCSFAPAHTYNNNTRNFFFNGFLPPSYFYSPTTCIVREFHCYTILITIISAPQTFLFCVLSSFIDY